MSGEHLIILWGYGPVGTAVLELASLLKKQNNHLLTITDFYLIEKDSQRLNKFNDIKSTDPKSATTTIINDSSTIPMDTSSKTIPIETPFSLGSKPTENPLISSPVKEKGINPSTRSGILKFATKIFEQEADTKFFDDLLQLLKTSSYKTKTIIDVTSNTNTIKFLEFLIKYSGDIHYINTSFESNESMPIPQQATDKTIFESTTYHQHLYTNKNIKPNIKNTFVLEAGMNPGLISHFSKELVRWIYKHKIGNPTFNYASMAQKLEIVSIQCSEIDTQTSKDPKKRNEFVNTWSVLGFISEGDEAIQIGNGIPYDSNTEGSPLNLLMKKSLKRVVIDSSKNPKNDPVQIFRKTGFNTQLDSNVPFSQFTGYVIPHGEGITLAEFFTVYDSDKKPIYRPQTCYVYSPCVEAQESIQEHLDGFFHNPKLLYGPNLIEGVDKVGALVQLKNGEKYWYGSSLSLSQTRDMGFVESGPTAVQVAVGLINTWKWVIDNPKRGLIYPEEMESYQILKESKPFLGTIIKSKI